MRAGEILDTHEFAECVTETSSSHPLANTKNSTLNVVLYLVHVCLIATEPAGRLRSAPVYACTRSTGLIVIGRSPRTHVYNNGKGDSESKYGRNREDKRSQGPRTQRGVNTVFVMFLDSILYDAVQMCRFGVCHHLALVCRGYRSLVQRCKIPYSK